MPSKKGVGENLVAWAILVVGGWLIHHLTGLATGWTIALVIALVLLASGVLLRFGHKADSMERRIQLAEQIQEAWAPITTEIRQRAGEWAAAHGVAGDKLRGPAAWEIETDIAFDHETMTKAWYPQRTAVMRRVQDAYQLGIATKEDLDAVVGAASVRDLAEANRLLARLQDRLRDTSSEGGAALTAEDGESKLSVRLQALSDEVADLHLKVTLTAPTPTSSADFDIKMLQSDAHRTMTRAEWGRDYVPRIMVLVEEAEAAGLDVSLMNEGPWSLLAGPHPIQDVAGRLAILANRARKAKL